MRGISDFILANILVHNVSLVDLIAAQGHLGRLGDPTSEHLLRYGEIGEVDKVHEVGFLLKVESCLKKL